MKRLLEPYRLTRFAGLTAWQVWDDEPATHPPARLKTLSSAAQALKHFASCC